MFVFACYSSGDAGSRQGSRRHVYRHRDRSDNRRPFALRQLSDVQKAIRALCAGARTESTHKGSTGQTQGSGGDTTTHRRFRRSTGCSQSHDGHDRTVHRTDRKAAEANQRAACRGERSQGRTSATGLPWCVQNNARSSRQGVLPRDRTKHIQASEASAMPRLRDVLASRRRVARTGGAA
jgi:hypothetical protein